MKIEDAQHVCLKYHMDLHGDGHEDRHSLLTRVLDAKE